MNKCTLNKLNIGDKARVFNLNNKGSIRRRLQDIGIVEGTKIECLYRSPLGDPTAFYIRGAVIALRNDDSKHIFVIPDDH